MTKVYERENDEGTLTVKVKYVGRFDSFHIDFNLGSISDGNLGKDKGESYYWGSEHVTVVRHGIISKLKALFSSKDSRTIAKEKAIREADKAFEKRNKKKKICKRLERNMQD